MYEYFRDFVGGMFWTVIFLSVGLRFMVNRLGQEDAVKGAASRGVGMFLNKLFK